jgi:hypothetical protein
MSNSRGSKEVCVTDQPVFDRYLSSKHEQLKALLLRKAIQSQIERNRQATKHVSTHTHQMSKRINTTALKSSENNTKSKQTQEENESEHSKGKTSAKIAIGMQVWVVDTGSDVEGELIVWEATVLQKAFKQRKVKGDKVHITGEWGLQFPDGGVFNYPSDVIFLHEHEALKACVCKNICM